MPTSSHTPSPLPKKNVIVDEAVATEARTSSHGGPRHEKASNKMNTELEIEILGDQAPETPNYATRTNEIVIEQYTLPIYKPVPIITKKA